MTLQAAQEMGRRSWKSKTPEEQAAHIEMMHAGRRVKLTPEQRSELARNAAKKRWAKKRAAKKKEKPRA